MELNTERKKTEVGLIPIDWEVRTLREITQSSRPISYGIVQTGKSIYGGVQCIRVVDIENGAIDDSGLITTSQEISDSYSRTVLREGDLVIALRGKIGQVAVVPKKLEGANLTRGVALLAIDAPNHGPFVQQFLSSPVGISILEKNLNGTALQELPISSVRNVPIAVPSPPEQRTVAAALSDVDALLAALDRLIAKKRAVKTAAMQQLLTGRQRLPGFSGAWETTCINDVAQKITGYWGATEPSAKQSIAAKIVRAGDISPSGSLTGTAERFLSDDEFDKARCHRGDVLITTSGNGLGKVWLCDGSPRIAASNFVRILRPAPKRMLGSFLYYTLRGDQSQLLLKEHTATSAYPNLRSAFFEVPWLHLPSIAEQNAIASVFADMDAEIAALEARRAKTKQIKQGMMQELLTGRTRLV